MIFQVLLLASVAATAPSTNSLDYVDPNPSYAVAWEVKNESTYDDKSHQETLQDGTVEGHYSYLRPDGKRQVVTYRANDEIGFVVNIDVQDVMPAFGKAGRPASVDAVAKRGKSLTITTGTGSFGSQATSKSLSSRSSVPRSAFASTGKSFSSRKSLGKSQSFKSIASQNNINRGTLEQKRKKPVPNIPVVPQTSNNLNIRTAFERPAPVIQSAVVQPAAAVGRIPVQRPSAAAQPVLQSAFRPVSNAQSAFKAAPNAQSSFRSVSIAQSAFRAAPNVQSTFRPVPNAPSTFIQAPKTQSSFRPVPNAQFLFGHVPNAQSAFGAVPNVQSTFEPVPNTQTAFGPVPNVQSAFGLVPNAQSAFGSVSNAQSAFESVPNVQSAFEPVPNAQSAFETASTAERGFTSAPIIQPVAPRITTRRPLPPRPITTNLPPPPSPTTISPPPSSPRPSINHARNFPSAFSTQAGGNLQSTGVAHVTFNSPTHQYSYPLVANN